MSEEPPEKQTPADEYKAEIAELTKQAEHLRETNRKRANELAEELVQLDTAMDRAVRRAALTRAVVDLYWEAALEALWAESWLRLKPKPLPDPDADPARLEELEEDLARRADDLRAALRRRVAWLQLRRD